MVDIMRTHPMIIIGGVLQENPFFVPPDEFLHELQERAKGGGEASLQPGLARRGASSKDGGISI